MIQSAFQLALLVAVLVLIDSYVWSGFRVLLKKQSAAAQRRWKWIFAGFSMLSILALAAAYLVPADFSWRNTRTLLLLAVLIPYLSKLLFAVFLAADDLRRAGIRLVRIFRKPRQLPERKPGEGTIPRSTFLVQTATAAGGGLLGTFAFGIISGAHDYRVHRVRIPIRNLPGKFQGIRIAQLSDIHSGSFFNKTAVKGGVEMLLKEKPDIAFFTGDLVNERSEEVRDYISIFEKVKAPLGVYSTLGNHDYGDYVNWKSAAAKQKNLADLVEAHRLLGWDLLMDEHRVVRVEGEEIGVIGIQNWGGDPFPKYGRLEKSLEGTADMPVKILLSHDPSHWNAQVTRQHPEIDLALAGHTHGLQFGIELPGFRWSPSQYRYKQWAGLYREGDQHLYVNRGFGFIGYPGRVGIWPEITILELVKA